MSITARCSTSIGSRPEPVVPARLVGAILIVVCFGGIGQALPQEGQQQYPTLQEHLDAFLQAFNTGQGEDLQEFIGKHYQPGIDTALEVNRWQRWSSLFGPVALHSTVDSSTDRLRVFVQSDITRAWVELTVRASRSVPGKLRTIAVGTGLRPPGARVPRVRSSAEMVEVMEAYLDRLASSDYFSGVVVLARDGVPLLEKAYGYSSRSHRSKNRTDTKFNIGSITKVFTALSVLQLVEKRAITLDDPAWCHVPDYPGGLDKAITIRHLLTHTSGMGRGAFDAPLFPVHARSIADWLPLTVAEPAFAPGEGVDYSNGAFVVLGAIIEQVTGMSYDDYVAENIYRRAGMTSSGAFELDDLRENLAIGYTHARSFGTGQVIQFEPGPRRNSLFLNGIKGNPAGLTYTTAADLLAFEKALRQHRLLGPDLTRLFLEPQVEVPGEPESGVTRQFGFGWEFESGTGPEFIGKDGGSWGVSARFAMFPRSAHTLVVLSNYDSIAPIVAGYLGELIAGLEASPGEDK